MKENCIRIVGNANQIENSKSIYLKSEFGLVLTIVNAVICGGVQNDVGGEIHQHATGAAEIGNIHIAPRQRNDFVRLQRWFEIMSELSVRPEECDFHPIRNDMIVSMMVFLLH